MKKKTPCMINRIQNRGTTDPGIINKVDQSLSLPGNNVDCADDEYGKVGCAE